MRRLAVIVALGLVLVSCGGGSDGDAGVATLENEDGSETLAAPEDALAGADDAAGDELSPEEALLAFTACLRDHGVDIDDPTVDADGNLQLFRPLGRGEGSAGGPGDDAFREAREACAPLLQSAALGFGDRVDRTQLQDDLIEFAACMRENGYDMPDPDFSSFGPGQGGGGPFGDFDPEDPAFQDAAEACSDVFTGFGGRFAGPRPAPGGSDG